MITKWDDPNSVLRWAPWATIAGALLIMVTTLLHPITVDPWNAEKAIDFISEHRPRWMWDHGLMGVAILLWLGGLALCFSGGNTGKTRSSVAIALLAASIGMWLVTLAFELGGMPISVDNARMHADHVHRTLTDSLFASSLFSGYLAMIPAWLAVALGAPARWGSLSGCVGVAGIGYCLLEPSVWILALTHAVPYVWTIWFAWRVCRSIPS